VNLFMTESRLCVITFDEKDQWNRIVKRFHQFDVYYLHEYVSAFVVHGDGVPLLFYYKDEHIEAMNVVMKRDISTDTRFTNKIPSESFYDFITPYGYGGFLIEGTPSNESITELFNQYHSYCLNNGVISEFVRFHPVLNNSEVVKDFYELLPIGRTVMMDLSSPDVIWNNLASDKKKKIRKAQKTGVEIYSGNAVQLIDEFIQMYKETMQKNNASNYYYFNKDFFRRILEDLKDHCTIFYAVLDGKKIAMAIYFHINERINCFLSASDVAYDSLAPTNLIMVEAALWGSQNHYKTLHMGGGLGGKEDRLFNYKIGFNKDSTTQFIVGSKIYNEAIYNELVTIRNFERDNQPSFFFPLYRK